MGIKGLNKYFKQHASPKSIFTLSLEELHGKTLVFDTSIYLYKFLETGELMQNMFLLISQCMQHKITPMFVFDGKPPIMKQDALRMRYLRKMEAYEKWQLMKEEYSTMSHTLNNEQKAKVEKEMMNLQKQSIRIRPEDIIQVKALMDALGVYWCDAPNESDTVCAYYVKKKIAWACVSDDMDMFVYDCPRVLREWDISHGSAVLYDFVCIKKDLGISSFYIRDILLLVGNDYIQTRTYSMDTMMKFYKEYKKSEHTRSTIDTVQKNYFYDWLIGKGYLVYDHAKQVRKTFSLYVVPEHMIWKKPRPNTPPVLCMEAVQTLMAPYGFLFSI